MAPPVGLLRAKLTVSLPKIVSSRIGMLTVLLAAPPWPCRWRLPTPHPRFPRYGDAMVALPPFSTTL